MAKDNTNRKTIGVDMGGTNTVYAIVDAKGKILGQRSFKTASYPSAEDFAKALSAKIRALIDDTGEADDIIGIGVGAPAANFSTGYIEKATNLPWPFPVPLAQLIERHSGYPTRVANDANTAALGEMAYGAARGVRDFIELTLGTGVGSGIVCNGRLLNGARGFAGELGHMPFHFAADRDCSCGRKGCLETVAAAGGIVHTAKLMLNKHPHIPSELRDMTDFSCRDIAIAAGRGDEIAQRTFRFTGECLGEAAASFASFSDPEAIIIFGGVANAGELLLKPMRESFERHALFLYRGRVTITQSILNESVASILGAASLPLCIASEV